MTTDHNAIWRAAVEAAAQVLGAHADLASLSAVDRQQIALAIGQATAERIDASASHSLTAKLEAFGVSFRTLSVSSARCTIYRGREHIDLTVDTDEMAAALSAELGGCAPTERSHNGRRWTEVTVYVPNGPTVWIVGGNREVATVAA